VGGSAALSGCSDNPYNPEAPAIDPNAPRVHITAPGRGTFAGDVRMLAVSGTVSGTVHGMDVASLQVNGVDAIVGSDGTWTATIPVGTGTQLIQAVARDGDGNIGKESRAVVVGPLQPLEMVVPRAITVAMSAETFEALGRGVTGFLEDGQLAATIAPSNPVLSAGGGPDCLYVQASITSAAVGPDTRVSLVPQPGGVALDVELDRVAVGMHLQYAVACLDGSRDVTIAASHIKITGTLHAGITGGGFDVALVDQHVQITGFDVDLGGVPGEISDLLHLDSAVIGPIIGLATEKLVVPALNRALTQLNDVNSIDVLGTPIDIKLVPRRLSFDAGGAIVELDSSLRARADAGSPGYVYVANQAPAMASESGFQLAIADDAANQLLGSYWAAHGMNLGFDLTTGSYGNLGTLYDRIELSAKVPPFVDASGTTLGLTIGDLVATFKRGTQVATQVAINAQLRVKVVTGDDGVPRLDVGNPVTYVDVLDENVDGANPLSNAQFEAITSFALGRVIAVGSATLGSIPLPSMGGVAVRDLEIAEQTGYLVVGGNIQ
jgi:hypothetical protein